MPPGRQTTLLILCCTRQQVAKLLGVSAVLVGQVPPERHRPPRFIKIGRAVRYALSAAREFILSRQRNSTSGAVRCWIV